jgi:hypothetical protein
MKRDPALVTLSRDHHHALAVAQKLGRSTAETAAEARAAFVEYWLAHGRAHFRREEEILLPAYADHGDPYHPLVARVLCDHVAIRARADALVVDSVADWAVLHDLGTRMADHVRLDERELFPLVEAALPTRGSPPSLSRSSAPSPNRSSTRLRAAAGPRRASDRWVLVPAIFT